MREERGKLLGDLTISEPYTLWGTIAGNVTAVKGAKLYIRGSIYGDLIVEYGGRVHIYGNITGNLIVADGAKVIHSGVLGGDAINNGGRLFVDAGAKIVGKIKTRAGGETKLDSKFKQTES